MNKANIEKYRERILAEKARLEQAHARISDAGEGGMSDRLSEIANFDPNHPGDVGTEMSEIQKDMALHENVEGMLAHVAEALAKIDAGTYGTCDRCGQPIADARLQALPYATLCIDCQSYVENTQ